MKVDFADVLKKVAACSNINLTFFKDGDDETADFDLGLRENLLGIEGKRMFFDFINQHVKAGVLYYVEDFFEVEYCALRIPPAAAEYGSLIVLGPYCGETPVETAIYEVAADKGMPESYVAELKEYYNAVPVIANMNYLRALYMGMAQLLYEQEHQLPTEYIRQEQPGGEFQDELSTDILSFKMIEDRYAAEAGTLEAITNGNFEEGMKWLHRLEQFQLARRYQDPNRDTRNLMVVINSLWRKAAEMACVHPAYIDALSTELAKRIELVSSKRDSNALKAEMMRKYCLLVRNHSLRRCSPVIQKVVNHINLSLTEDLSLKILAAEYSVNGSYLSGLFKQEMGMTLTDYIIQQRIRRAIMLLNSTGLPIQEVAARSGIYDVGYFRKLFKRVTGKTPTEYVKEVKCR